MRSLFRAAVGAAVALSAVIVPLAGAVPPVSAAGNPKVVIVVGPVGGTTASYRSDADAAAAEAAKYTTNVVKIYSPNATWDVVKPALQGASIVIYMGHGNGFPSPYTSTLQPDRQDGFGLNPKAGGDDSATKYWGEQYVASDVHLAPNAVVILGHLCYASGSSEPGKAEPTPDQARQRVDNFAAGFLASGARAVIAEAYHGSAANYVSALFTAHTTVGAVWETSPTAQGGVFSFPSTRTPGMTAQMDPDRSSGKYYRSIVGDMSLSTDAVVSQSGPALTPTPAPPPPPSPTPTPGTGTPTPKPTPTPSAPDDAKVDLTSSGISLTSISAPTAFSPNGDGRQDTFGIHAVFSARATWQLTIADAYGTIYLSTGGLGDSVDMDWDGTSNGARQPDGIYTYRLSAADGLGGVLDRIARVRIDTSAPVLSPATGAGPPAAFSPNGDGAADAWTAACSVSEPATIEATVLRSDGTVVRHLKTASAAGSAKVTWDGRSDAGAGVADGQYVITFLARDAAGNAAAGPPVGVNVYRALARVTASATLFYPQDGDQYAASTTLGFTLLAPATVTWTVVDQAGRLMVTQLDGVAVGPGPTSWRWTGTDASGNAVAPGTYTAVLTAANGVLSITSRTVLTVAAFRTTVSPTTAVRGRNITVTALSAEPLVAAPRLTISQPGVAVRSVAMVKVATNTWRITTRLSSAGKAGTLSLKVTGTDAGHGSNVAAVSVSLR